jgi:broad-specificity NMP kinase
VDVTRKRPEEVAEEILRLMSRPAQQQKNDARP